MRNRNGFTLVELLITIAVLAILATITAVSYDSWRHKVAVTSVQNDVGQATAMLKSYKNFQNNYPPNLAGINFAASTDDALTLYTNAPSVGIYSGLTPDQNAQLFLNVCNANLNGLNNTVCTFAGNGNGAKIHVKGTVGSNTIWPSPINQGDVVLNCGSACDAATSAMITQFTAQGGAFPIVVSGTSATLPPPNQKPNGPASAYCLEGRSGSFPDIAYHSTNENIVTTEGTCPDDPSLHYYPTS